MSDVGVQSWCSADIHTAVMVIVSSVATFTRLLACRVGISFIYNITASGFFGDSVFHVASELLFN